MKKKYMVAIALAALLIGGGLWYGRPMTVQQLCPELDLGRCSSITAYSQIVPSATGLERLELEADSPAFEAVLAELQGRTFCRSLTSLLPRGTRTVRTEDGDFQWVLQLEFDQPMADSQGNGYSGVLIRLENFFGRLSLDHMPADRTWDLTTEDQEAWVARVMDLLSAAKG